MTPEWRLYRGEPSEWSAPIQPALPCDHYWSPWAYDLEALRERRCLTCGLIERQKNWQDEDMVSVYEVITFGEPSEWSAPIPPVTPNLKPCPFCDGEAVTVSGGPGCHFVKCKACGTSTTDGAYERVIDRWNTRTAPAE